MFQNLRMRQPARLIFATARDRALQPWPTPTASMTIRAVTRRVYDVRWNWMLAPGSGHRVACTEGSAKRFRSAKVCELGAQFGRDCGCLITLEASEVFCLDLPSLCPLHYPPPLAEEGALDSALDLQWKKAATIFPPPSRACNPATASVGNPPFGPVGASLGGGGRGGGRFPGSAGCHRGSARFAG